MPDVSESLQSRSENLCIACGLCCSGHLFTHANVGDDEIPAAESLELPLDKFKESGNRHFYLPCPRFTGKCSVYDDPRKPRICTIYKCDLLKALEAQKVTLEQALIEVQETKGMIEAIHAILPEDAGKNFCIELLPYLDALERADIHCDAEGDQNLVKAAVLLVQYSRQFGVSQLFANRRKLLVSR